MTRVLVALAAAACVAVVLAPVGGAAGECRGIAVCISVPGPWVVVPARGEAQYLLACPRRRGVVGGLDALATSRDVRVSWDARIGAPVAPGTSTGRDAFFRGVGARSRAAFQPYIGCIPAGGGGGRSTTSARVTRPGVPVERRAVDVKLRSGVTRRAVARCAANERLVGSWHALAFRTPKPPNLALAPFVAVETAVVAHSRVVARIFASDGLPNEAHAEVQVGAVCAP